jgi:predicted metal-binding membrane protein
MRYQSAVSSIADFQAPAHLSKAETRLAAVLAQPRRIAIACIVVLAGAGWLALGLMAPDAAWGALCLPMQMQGWDIASLLLPMWVAMTLAMMLPSAGPMILTYAEIADTAVAKGESVVSPLVLGAGYLAVWLGFAVLAAGLQGLLAQREIVASASPENGMWLAGLLFLAAGIYQFSALKRACLTQCQRPFPFFFAHWTSERRGVFRLGLRQGLYCLGCCWAMMLLMLASGTMNVIWMAVLGAIMTAEKLATTARLSRIFGFGFCATGVGTLAFLLSHLEWP